MLASGTTIEKTAAQVKCSEKSISLWKHQTEFLDAIRQAEDDLYNNSLRLLKRTAKDAIDCLIRNMGGKVSPYVQVSAASKLLDAGLEVHKIAALEQEVAELRELLQAKEQLDQWQQ